MSFSFTDRLTELNNARERSLITDEEYTMLRGRLFESFVAGPPTSSSPASPFSQQQYFSPPLLPQQLSSSPQHYLSSNQQFPLPPRQFSLPPHQNSTAQASSSSSSVSISHSNESTSTSPLSLTPPSSSPRLIKSVKNNTGDTSLTPGSRSNIVPSLSNVTPPRRSRSNNALSSLSKQINNNNNNDNKNHKKDKNKNKNKNIHFVITNAATSTSSDNVGMHTTGNDVHDIGKELQPLSISEAREPPEITENLYSSSAPSASTISSSGATSSDLLNIPQTPPRRSLTTSRPSSMICTNSEHVSFEINRRNRGVDENNINESQQQSPRQIHSNLFKKHARSLSLGFNSSILSFGNNSSNQNNGSHSSNNDREGIANDRNGNNNSVNNVSDEITNANSRTMARSPESNIGGLTGADQFEQLVPEVPPPPYTPPEPSQTRGRRLPSAFFTRPKTSAELRKELQKLIEQSKKEASSLKIEEARLRMRFGSRPEELDRVRRKMRESSEKYRKKIEAVNSKLRQINNVDGGGGRSGTDGNVN